MKCTKECTHPFDLSNEGTWPLYARLLHSVITCMCESLLKCVYTASAAVLQGSNNLHHVDNSLLLPPRLVLKGVLVTKESGFLPPTGMSAPASCWSSKRHQLQDLQPSLFSSNICLMQQIMCATCLLGNWVPRRQMLACNVRDHLPTHMDQKHHA